ncbi:hypothetical protein ACFW9D_22735 [Streptomyces sp. NPDC059524]|uniref:hypothetical protein n=1 Tax=Streptomyces sp. NPDC059524 TaxID=3346856 RepID=UPI0036B13EFC
MSPHYAYEVRLHRMGRLWALDIPDLGLHTQCRTLERVDELARGLVAEAVGVSPDVIELSILVPELAPLLNSVAEARRRRAAALDAENEAIAAAVHELVDELHVSQGDAGHLLGMPLSEVAHFTPARPDQASGLPRSSIAAAFRPGHDRAPRSRQATSKPRPSWAVPPRWDSESDRA